MTLVYLALAWLLGLVLGARWPQTGPLWLCTVGAGLAVALLQIREPRWRLAGVLLALGGLGAARVGLSPLHTTPLAPYLGGPAITLTGTVVEAPNVRADRTELVFRVETVARPPGDVTTSPVGDERPQPVRDAVLLLVPRESPYRYGDRLRVVGPVRPAPALPGFSYRDYLARRGIHGRIEWPAVEILGRGGGNSLQAALIALADRAEGLIATLWPAPESALLAGILLGRERNLPEPLLQAFDDTGTRHIIAISGFNITLLAGVLTRVLLTFLKRRAAVPLVIVLLAFYVVLVGGDASVVRAGLMGGLALLALLAGRRSDALTGLAVSAFLMTLWRPWTLWESSFQLSFAATLGLIVLLPRIEAWVGVANGTAKDSSTKDAKSTNTLSQVSDGERRPRFAPFAAFRGFRAPDWLREAVLVSLAAQVATLPITLGAFGRLSLVAPLANLLILPAQAAVMQLGALATVLGLLWRPLGQAVAWLAWPFAAWTIRVAEALGSLPWAAVDLRTVDGLPWALYVVAGLCLWFRQGRERLVALRRHLPTKALLVGLAALAALIWIGGVARLPDGRLHVTFLDVGQGDAILIRTPDGKWLLLDGGPDPTRAAAALGRRLYPWQRTIDLVALTHPDEDHLAGLLPVLRHYRAGLLLDTRNPRDTPSGQAWEALLAPYAVPSTPHPRLTFPTRGTILDLGPGVRLEVLHPGDGLLQNTRSDSNNNSLVLRLTYGRASFLLTGDLELEGEQALLALEHLPLDSTVLKVSHHGARTSTTLRFLEAVTPQVAVVSVGAGNRFGHPNPEVLGRLAAAGAQVWRTDECGDVQIVTDGERLWVWTGKQGEECQGR